MEPGGQFAVAGRVFTIRPASPADAEPLFEVSRRAFGSAEVASKVAAAVRDYGGIPPSSEHATQSTSISSRYLVCDEKGGRGPVGMIGNYRLRWIGRQNAYLGWFFVEPDLQRNGIGGALLEATIELLKGEGCRYLFVETAPTPIETVHFYNRAGFRSVALIEDYWEDGSPLVLMRLAL